VRLALAADHFAQAGGKNPAKLPEALQIAKTTIRKMIGG